MEKKTKLLILLSFVWVIFFISQLITATAWVLTDYVYDNINISTQDTASTGLFFSSDGTKLYETGYSGMKIYQYSCSSAWNLSSCSYDNINISTQDGDPEGLFFKADGTKLYEIGADEGKIYQYSCTTGWNLSSCSYDNVNISAQDGDPNGLFFKADGTKLYEVGWFEEKIYQYSCSSAWNLSSCSYDNVNISTQDTGPMDLFFKADGTKLYEIGYNGDKIYQYSCTTAWNLSSCSYDNINISTQDTGPMDLFFKADGTKLYEIGYIGKKIYQYTLDEIPPASTFGTNPINNYNSSSFSVIFDFKSYDNANIHTIQLWGNWTGIWHANYTNISYTNDTWLNITVNGIPDGNYIWGIFSNDSAGNSDWTDTNRTITIDTIAPSISIVYPSNNTNTSNSGIDINYTVSDNKALSSCWYSNDTYSVNTTITCGQNITTVTWSEGQHNVTIWTNDTANNVNSSSVTFIIDILPPNITINSITTTTGSKTVTFNSTVTDNLVGVQSCKYSVYNPSGGLDLENITFTCNSDTSISVSTFGTYTLKVYAKDYVDNENSTNKSFTTSDFPVTSGGSSGGIVVGQPTQTHTWTTITANEPATMTITNPEMDLTKITITTIETITDASLTITTIDTPQADLEIGLPSGISYQAFKIDTRNINDTNIANVTIEFKVTKSWLEQQNATNDFVKLYRKEDIASRWDALETNIMGGDDQYYYFTSISSGFSSFVVFIAQSQCTPGDVRCFNNEIQLCLGNYTWVITKKCEYGCEGNKCIGGEGLGVVDTGSIVLYFIVTIISTGILIILYFIFKYFSKKQVQEVWKKSRMKRK